MHEQGTPSSIEDALLWLNDRLGKSVAVWVEVDRGIVHSVLSVEGELRHWSEGRSPDRVHGRDDVAGLYDIGDGGCSIDLSDLEPLGVWTVPDDVTHLVVRIDESTTLDIVEQEDDE